MSQANRRYLNINYRTSTAVRSRLTLRPRDSRARKDPVASLRSATADEAAAAASTDQPAAMTGTKYVLGTQRIGVFASDLSLNNVVTCVILLFSFTVRTVVLRQRRRSVHASRFFRVTPRRLSRATARRRPASLVRPNRATKACTLSARRPRRWSARRPRRWCARNP